MVISFKIVYDLYGAICDQTMINLVGKPGEPNEERFPPSLSFDAVSQMYYSQLEPYIVFLNKSFLTVQMRMQYFKTLHAMLFMSPIPIKW